MHVLVTRPKNQAERTVSSLLKLGHSCTVEPMLLLKALETDKPSGPVDGLIITSANSLAALQQTYSRNWRKQIPLLATGPATAEAARMAGFERSEFVSGSALDLVQRVPDWMLQNGLGPSAQLLYPSAETTAHDLPGLLSQYNITCVGWPVYQMTPIPRLSKPVEKLLKNGTIVAVLLYSKRTAHTFVELMSQSGISITGLRAFVLSQEIFDALPEALQINTEYPTEPSEEALFELLAR